LISYVAAMATISGLYIPAEVLRLIVYYTIGGLEMTGRGVGVVRDLSLVSRGWQQATFSQLAQVPQKKKREKGNGKIVRVAPAVVIQPPVTGGAGSGCNVGAELDIVLEDEVMLKGGPLRVGEVVVWKDLEHAARCIQLNRENLLFWERVRAIFLSFVKAADERLEGDLRLAHGVFAGLHKIVSTLRDSGVQPKLEWLRLALVVWQGLEDMDAPGMFYLSRLHGIPFVRFHSPLGKSLSCYISKEVKDVIAKRTSRTRLCGWTPTGLESPCPRGDWRVQALRRRKKGELENECLLRFLIERYNSRYD
jgi:hypothetical protein